MRAIRLALEEHGAERKLSESIAFDLAEIRSELDQVKSLIDAVSDKKGSAMEPLLSLESTLVYHWLTHIKTLKRSLDKLLHRSEN